VVYCRTDGRSSGYPPCKTELDKKINKLVKEFLYNTWC
jgi:hypothetical protein